MVLPAIIAPMPKMKVLTWNTWNNEKLSNIISLLLDVGADVSCCQEVSAKRARKIAEALGQNFYCAGDVAIFSNYAITESRSKIMPAADNHVYIEAGIKIGREQLYIGTVHLTYSRGFEMNAERLAEGHHLVDLISSHKDSFILTGDMNAAPDSTIIKQIQQNLKSAGPDFSRATWTTKHFSYDSFEADSLDWRLDYIFVTPEIEVITSDVIDTSFSDHLPVLAEVDV